MIAGLVSCLIPTCGREALALQAIKWALAQSWEPLEVVVLDGGSGVLAELFWHDERVRYCREPERVLGAKRNRLAELARGEWLACWDDDDWQGPERVAVQVEALRRAPGAGLCAWSPRLLHYRPPESGVWVGGLGSTRHHWDCTQMWRAAAWRPVPAIQSGARAIRAGELVASGAVAWIDRPEELRHYLARVHNTNTTPKPLEEHPGRFRRWEGVTVEDVQAGRADWSAAPRRAKGGGWLEVAS